MDHKCLLFMVFTLYAHIVYSNMAINGDNMNNIGMPFMWIVVLNIFS